MRTPTVSVMWLLVLSCWLYFVANARGQEMKAGCDELAGISPVAGVIRDRPFSARSYIRTFAVQSDGTRRFIRNERYPIRVARNSAGCVRVDFVDEPEEACAQLDVLVPIPCRDWDVAVFDLARQVVTHWTGGERGYPGPVVIRMAASQVEDAKRYTTDLPMPLTEIPPEEPDLRVDVLGERVIEGLRVVGVRQTRTVRIDASHSHVQMIHEVWISPELKVVVEVIDGDPGKQLTIAGLEHIERQADESLFQPVEGYPVRRYPHSKSQYAVEDLRALSYWFVRSFDGGD